MHVPEDLESVDTDILVALAYEVGALVVGDSGREDIIRRIRKMALQ